MTPGWVRALALLLVALFGVLAACGQPARTGGGPQSGTVLPTGSPSAAPGSMTGEPTPSSGSADPARTEGMPTSAPFSSLVTSSGVRQWLSCSGTGPLTLVVIPGLNASSAAWTPVLAGFERSVRTCVYDRPGLGRSPGRPVRGETVDAGLLAGELWSLLRAAGQRGPYVVLGHSFGGLIARAMIAEHRTAVRGVLLAESVTPGDPTVGRYWTEAGHRVDMVASSAATHGGPALGDIPLLVLSASRPDEDHLGGHTYGQPSWMTALWVRQQHADLELSSDSVQVLARSGHVLQQDDPAAVVEAVRELVRAVRSGQPLSCAGTAGTAGIWTALEATCR